MTEFEFFMELRVNSVEQLGQVRLAILETNGQISVFYYPDEEVNRPDYRSFQRIVPHAIPPFRKRGSMPACAAAS